ncbi:GntR family transcriptional regulator [Pseudomonas sp. SDO528_S397]
MNTLSSDVRLPLYQRLRDHLVEQIASLRWGPGEAIPPEAVLSSEYELSTGTVRKAVEALVGEGILERQQGRGTFVRRPQFKTSLSRFFRFEGPDGERLALESCIQSVESMPAPVAVAQALGLAPEALVIRIERVRRVGAQPVLTEQIWLPQARFQPLLALDLSPPCLLLYPLYETVCRQVVASAEETLMAVPASEADAQVLQIPAGSVTVVIERLARDYAGQPLEWRHSCGNAGHFHYRVDIR